MSFTHNDIATKQRLRDALEEETAMGFAHNDIVTTYAMDKAIAEGGGGGGDFTEITVKFGEEPDYHIGGIEASYNDISGLVSQGKIPYIVFTAEQIEALGNEYLVAGEKLVLTQYFANGNDCGASFTTLMHNGYSEYLHFSAESLDAEMLAE